MSSKMFSAFLLFIALTAQAHAARISGTALRPNPPSGPVPDPAVVLLLDDAGHTVASVSTSDGRFSFTVGIGTWWIRAYDSTLGIAGTIDVPIEVTSSNADAHCDVLMDEQL